MSNEEYLIISYFVVGIFCCVLPVIVYLFLRGSFMNIISLLPEKHFSKILRKLFFIGIFLPALLGFFSVSFKGCSIDTYDEIIKKRSYLVQKNKEQLSSSLNHTVYALMFWSVAVFSFILIVKKHRGKSND